MKVLLLLLLGALAPSLCSGFGLSYNVSSNYINYWNNLMTGKEYRASIESIDLSGIFWTAYAQNTSVTVHEGMKLRFQTLPKNSGVYKTFEKEANLYENDVEDYLNYDDLKPKKHHQTKNTTTHMKTHAGTSKTAKTTLSCVYCYSIDLEKETDGILLSVNNVSVTIDTFLELPSKKFPLKIELTGVELNHTNHFSYFNSSFQLLSSMCRLRYQSLMFHKSPLDSLDADMKEEMRNNFMKSVCNEINSQSKAMFSKIEEAGQMVFKLHEKLYFDNRINKFFMDKESFGFEHKAEFIYEPKKIEKIRSIAKDMIKNAFTASKTRISYFNFLTGMELGNLCEAMKEKKVVKEYVILYKKKSIINEHNLSPRFYRHFYKPPYYTIENFYARSLFNDLNKSFNMVNSWFLGSHGRNKRDAEMTKKSVDPITIKTTKSERKTGVSLKLGDNVFNSLIQGLVVNNISTVQFNKTDLENFCKNVKTSFCDEMMKCSKLDKKFFLTLELKQNNDGKYVVFDDDAISTNLTASVNYNGNVIEMEMFTKTMFSFKQNTLYYEVVQSRITLKAGQSLHSYFLSESNLDLMRKQSMGSFTLSDKHMIALSLNTGILHLTSHLPLETKA